MQSFLSKVISEVINKKKSISKLTFILPNKRSSLFLKTGLKEQLKNSVIFPRILSIDDFIKEISGLDKIDSISLIFQFYKIYKNKTKQKDLDSFEVFAKWAQILLQDFNEIDSNLVESQSILAYLNESKRMESWNLNENSQTVLINKYLAFFDEIQSYYTHLKNHLLKQHLGYSGLIYKKASHSIDEYIQQHSDSKFIFVGFNALNKAEENIIHRLLINNLAEIYWDNDRFYKNSNNLAGKYFKKYETNWNYYNLNKFKWHQSNINTAKNVSIHGLPKNITQIKKVANILQDLNSENQIQNTAIILGNENLLPILLNSIPKEINPVNITMGYNLKNIPLTNFFNSLFQLHLNKLNNKNEFYYKDFLKVLEHSLINRYWINNKNFRNNLNKLIIEDKTYFISNEDIKKLIEHHNTFKDLFYFIFMGWQSNIEIILQKFILIIEFIKKDKTIKTLEKEYLFRFENVFQQLINLNSKYGYITNLKTLYLFYNQLLNSENLSFHGEPLKGLQIMGLLESRVLDFDNVIITSVNEGFLPASNSPNSFIPTDIKSEKGIPTYKEKDSVFAYHFFRLFHRAKNIYILYNTETDNFGSGEQSRFISQLETAKKNNLLENVHITKNIILPKIKPDPIILKEIEKTSEIIFALKKLAQKGFSPSSLSLFIRNPIEFYKQKVLNLKEFKEVEESIAANTFGTIIHDSLEFLYTPFLNKFITKEDISPMKEKLNMVISHQFKKHYPLKTMSFGKNYLTFEIAKQFLRNFLNYEISYLEHHKSIKILALEHNISYKYNMDKFSFPIMLKGQIDRIDEVDGVLRIIDYKTGKVDNNNLKINDWDLLVNDEKYSKSFQVLLYAYMYVKANNIDISQTLLESGIISFKNLKSGFMRVNNKNITQETLDNFLIPLNELISSIFNPKLPFAEKELDPFKF